MGQAARRRATSVVALGCALLLNAAALWVMTRQEPYRVEPYTTAESRAVFATLIRAPERVLARPPPLQPAKTAVAARRRPLLATTAVSRPSPPTAETSPKSLPATPPAQTAAGPPGGSDDAARTATALRRLGACAGFDEADKMRAGCSPAWSDTGQHVEALSAQQRSAFATSTPDDRIARSAKVRDALSNHDGHGSHINFGCTLKGEKLTCGTY